MMAGRRPGPAPRPGFRRSQRSRCWRSRTRCRPRRRLIPRREDAERREAEDATGDEEAAWPVFGVVDWFQQAAREPGPAQAFGTAPSPKGVEAVRSCFHRRLYK